MGNKNIVKPNIATIIFKHSLFIIIHLSPILFLQHSSHDFTAYHGNCPWGVILIMIN